MNSTDTDLAKRLDTIAKLLAKAESTQYPAEAEALTEQAERMMVRYGIDKAAVDFERGKRGEVRENIIEVKVELHGTYGRVRMLGYAAVVEAFGTCTALGSSYAAKNWNWLYIIGAESDVNAMVRLVNSLVVQSDHALRAWWKSYELKPYLTDRQKLVERRTFQKSFASGAALRVWRMVQEAKDESGTGAGTELVLADRQQRAQAKAEELHGKVRSARSSMKGGTSHAAVAGKKAGLEANVRGGHEVEGRRAISV